MTLSLEGLRRYEIIDMSGKTVMQGQANGKQHTIDVSTLPIGMYFITIDGATQKFIIKR